MSRRGIAVATVLLAALGGLGLTPARAAAPTRLYLVTLEGPGQPGLLAGLRAYAEQDAVLASVGGPTPVYRWTTAINGVAVPLTPGQATTLRTQSGVALVEPDSVRRLAGRTPRAVGLVPGVELRDRGGAGVVVGVVDSGIAPDRAVFAATSGLGRSPRGFHGVCPAGPGWPEGTCNRKVVGARWFVDGFGADRVRSEESLSPLDEDGHGTQVASVLAGDADVTARVRGQRLGTYAGVAPQARLAVYKACWSAPDPHDDGCSVADLVSAVDTATADGVDVLNLSVGGGRAAPGFDTLERALLGATEAGVVVVAAAGNAPARPAAHPVPWVTTVGATSGPVREGRVRLVNGPSLLGAMAAARGVGPAGVVVGARVPAAGASRRDARLCTPGSLDAARVAGHVVVCERGGIGRVDKSAAVDLADGVGMVLVNAGPAGTVADFHRVPTVHVDAAAGRELLRWLGVHPDGRVRLEPLGADRHAPRVARWSSRGDPAGAVVKPDLVATGSGVLGAVPGEPGWDLAAGTSVATAATSGAAALLVARHPDWSPAVVRSALTTTARRVPGADVLAAGAGRLVADPGARPGLAYDVAAGDYRRWLSGTLAGDLNTPSIVLSGDADTAVRTITNVTGRRLYFSSHTSGFTRYQVRVVPAAVRLGPGQSASFTLTVGRTATPQPDDDGWVTWRGATGTITRIPVLVTR